MRARARTHGFAHFGAARLVALGLLLVGRMKSMLTMSFVVLLGLAAGCEVPGPDDRHEKPVAAEATKTAETMKTAEDSAAEATAAAEVAALRAAPRFDDRAVPEGLRGARLVPSLKDGKLIGLKVYAIAADSSYARAGLQNGDTLLAFDGADMSDTARLEAFKRAFDEHGQVSMKVMRRGATLEGPVLLKK